MEKVNDDANGANEKQRFLPQIILIQKIIEANYVAKRKIRPKKMVKSKNEMKRG